MSKAAGGTSSETALTACLDCVKTRLGRASSWPSWLCKVVSWASPPITRASACRVDAAGMHAVTERGAARPQNPDQSVCAIPSSAIIVLIWPRRLGLSMLGAGPRLGRGESPTWLRRDGTRNLAVWGTGCAALTPCPEGDVQHLHDEPTDATVPLVRGSVSSHWLPPGAGRSTPYLLAGLGRTASATISRALRTPHCRRVRPTQSPAVTPGEQNQQHMFQGGLLPSSSRGRRLRPTQPVRGASAGAAMPLEAA